MDLVLTDSGREYLNRLSIEIIDKEEGIPWPKAQDFVVLKSLDQDPDYGIELLSRRDTIAKTIVRRLFEAGYLDYGR